MRLVTIFSAMLLLGIAETCRSQELPPEILQRSMSGPKFLNSSGSGFRPSPAQQGPQGRPLSRGKTLREAITANRFDPLHGAIIGSRTAVTAQQASLRDLQAQQRQRRQAAILANRPVPVSRSSHASAHTLSLGFDTTSSPDHELELSQALTVRLTDLSEELGDGDFRVEVRGGTAVVTGRVISEHRKRVVGRLLVLEPGIKRVENRLKISGR